MLRGPSDKIEIIASSSQCYVAMESAVTWALLAHRLYKSCEAQCVQTGAATCSGHPPVNRFCRIWTGEFYKTVQKVALRCVAVEQTPAWYRKLKERSGRDHEHTAAKFNSLNSSRRRDAVWSRLQLICSWSKTLVMWMYWSWCCQK